MEKEKFSQLELFSQINSDRDLRIDRSESFFRNIRYHEKAMLIIMGFVITGIIAFSLGVEKGKKIVTTNSDSFLDVALRKQTRQSMPVSRESPIQYQPVLEKRGIKREPLQEQPDAKEYIQGYTIQVASFKTKVLAEREAESLKKKGLAPLFLSKSGYTVVCVGSFSNKEKASSLLSELKKRYRDCFVRRL